MPNLRRFSPLEIYISRHEAWAVLRFFWPRTTLTEGALTAEDISFAQALLLEAIDASYALGYVQVIFETFYGKIPGSFADVRIVVKEFAKKAAKHWFRHLGTKNPANAEIYQMVRDTISNNFKTVMDLRQITGELTY